MPMTEISPQRARALIDEGGTLVDIRDRDEYRRECIPGALNVPLSQLGDLPDGPLIFHCRSGMRTRMNAEQLRTAARDGECHIMDGGLDGWRAAGLPTRTDRKQPLEIMRQVQLAAGGLVLLGVALGFVVSPLFFGLSGFVGAGLMMAGATGWCGMAKVLGALPWNRRVQQG